MDATVRRYEGIDQVRSQEITGWIRDHDLVSALLNTPKITAGPLRAEACPPTPSTASRTHA